MLGFRMASLCRRPRGVGLRRLSPGPWWWWWWRRLWWWLWWRWWWLELKKSFPWTLPRGTAQSFVIICRSPFVLSSTLLWILVSILELDSNCIQTLILWNLIQSRTQDYLKTELTQIIWSSHFKFLSSFCCKCLDKFELFSQKFTDL